MSSHSFARWPAASWALLSLVGVLLAATTAHAVVVERVVAVVGERAILLSDVKRRAKPFLLRIHQQAPGKAQRAAAISQVFRQVLDQMIDERLQQQAARRSQIVVTAEEVDAAIERIAAQNKIPVGDLISEAVKSGMDESEYRKEIRRQVLDAKLMNLRIQGRIRVTEEDMRAEYHSLVAAERQHLAFRAAWIKLRSPRRASPARLAARRELAERITRQARSGADFAALAREYSDDPATRETGGLLARTEPGQLPGALDRVLMALDVGEVAAPVRVGDELVIVKLVERDASELPSFEEAAAELENRVYLLKMDQARRRWLNQLRRQTHVEIRL